jgi:deoxyribonuclease-4
MWQFAKPSEETIQKFVDLKNHDIIDPVYFHASYLINLANTSRVGDLSKNLLKHELTLASRLGIGGSIVHLGSYKDSDKYLAHEGIETPFDSLIANIEDILRDTPPDTFLIAENAGNKKIGLMLEELAEIVQRVSSDRLKICLDTCHLHAAGYDISSENKLDLFLNSFEKLIGLNRLEVIHCNDSKDSLGSFRDRHENIGAGHVGLEVFRLLLNHPKTKNIPFIAETPGFDGNGPDKKNLDILKSLTT